VLVNKSNDVLVIDGGNLLVVCNTTVLGLFGETIVGGRFVELEPEDELGCILPELNILDGEERIGDATGIVDSNDIAEKSSDAGVGELLIEHIVVSSVSRLFLCSIIFL
jgi:hypothetical protein